MMNFIFSYLYYNFLSGMPTSPYLYADDLIEVLKKKHASGTYNKLVCYKLNFHFLEAFYIFV